MQGFKIKLLASACVLLSTITHLSYSQDSFKDLSNAAEKMGAAQRGDGPQQNCETPSCGDVPDNIPPLCRQLVREKEKYRKCLASECTNLVFRELPACRSFLTGNQAYAGNSVGDMPNIENAPAIKDLSQDIRIRELMESGEQSVGQNRSISGSSKN